VNKLKATRAVLDRLLDKRNEHPEQLVAIEAHIREVFEQDKAVLVLDMCGFSRLTIKHGVIHYLAMIRRMHRVVLPIVAESRGSVVKTEADNVIAIFEAVPDAIRTARAINERLARANAFLPEDWDVHVGIGIGCGPVLMIGNHDLFGSEMNLASKLGEDLAKAGQVLLTEAAFAKAGKYRKTYTKRKTRIGKLALAYYQPKRA
jgi:class 3 adenylate cyclase